MRRVPQPNAPDWFHLQAIALQFHVTDRLDGSTFPLPFALPPSTDAVLDPDSGAVIQTVERLGLIDLTGGVTGGIADRIIRSILVVGPVAVGVGDNAVIQDAVDGIHDPLHTGGVLAIPVGANGISSLNCIFIPQTAQLQLDGLVATPGNPILVRICVWQPHTIEELAEMTQVCCCRANVFDEEGEPFYTTAIYSTAACSRTVNTAAPNSAARGSGLLVVTVGGANFADGDIVLFIHEDGLGTIDITQITFVSPVSIQVTIDVDGAVPLGVYNVFVSPPLAPPQCGGLALGVFTVTP